MCFTRVSSKAGKDRRRKFTPPGMFTFRLRTVAGKGWLKVPSTITGLYLCLYHLYLYLCLHHLDHDLHLDLCNYWPGLQVFQDLGCVCIQGAHTHRGGPEAGRSAAQVGQPFA